MIDGMSRRVCRVSNGSDDPMDASSPMWDLSQFAARPLSFPKRYAEPWSSSCEPRFAIVTPSLNHADFIKATIQSVF